MASIFPSYQVQKENEALLMPTYTNVLIDFNTGNPVIVDGDFVLAEKDEAIKVWCYFTLKIAKGRFLAFGNNYGNNFEDELIGKNYGNNNEKIERLVKECLLVNKYIKSIDKIEYSYKGDTLSMNITITTIYSKGVKVNG